ncbi:MAG: hypothetical protein IIC12_06150, partial [Proteobacteria bacterium]|nr:hypothetical protein [Pseudomonadota bacterium]
MKIAPSKYLLALLLCAFVAVNSPAQGVDDSTTNIAPDLNSLQNNWWATFEGSREGVQPRVDTFLENVGVQIAALAPQNQVIAQSVLDAVRDNFTAYLALLEDGDVALQQLSPAKVDYSIDILLGLAAPARSPRAEAK